MPEVKLQIQAYSAIDHGPHELRGFVKLGDTDVWEASYESGDPEVSRRGVNVMTIDPVTLEFHKNSDKTFDTHGKRDAAEALSKYLGAVKGGVIIVGVTAEEPMAELKKATGTLELLKAYGVDVNDVGERGNFAFVLQKDYLHKTHFKTSVNNSFPPSRLDVKLRTTSSGPAGLEIEPVCNPLEEDKVMRAKQ